MAGTTPTKGPQAKERLWTPANIVTLLRICGIPLFVVALLSPWPSWIPFWPAAGAFKEWIAAGIFIALAATDGLDGYLARSRGEVTNFGKFMDPLADKILVAAALLALIELGVLPSWVALVILAREFIVSGIRMVAAAQGVVIAASWYGKVKTVSQIVAIVLFIIKGSHMVSDFSEVLADRLYLFSWAVMAFALVMTVVSMLDYFAKAKSLLGFDRAAGPAEGAALPTDPSLPPLPTDNEELARKVIDLAREKKAMIGTAESCTGGLIAATLTSIAGSSDVVAGGIVSYSNKVKEMRLGVLPETLARHGAVSEETACEMAEGALRALGVDAAVSVTGIAGPGGGSPEKPVGTVWIGTADKGGPAACVHHFEGDRVAVRTQTVHEALAALYKILR